jgi:hypothetical protein
MDEEFNDWYDLEHLPQMLAVPGMDTANRFVAIRGWPRYLAIYDLSEFGVLRSHEYRAMTGSRFTPWSRRILSRVKGWQRMTFVQQWPGTAAMSPDCAAFLLYVYRGNPELTSAAEGLARKPGVMQARAFGPGEETNDGGALVVECGAVLALPRPPAEVITVSGGTLVFSAAYARYWRTDPVARFHSLEHGQ